MADATRVFILGAGFSKPAGMPLATQLLPLLVEQLKLDEMRPWLDGLQERLAWLDNGKQQTDSLAMNIEEVFHIAHFDIEVHRLKQQLAPVGRFDGCGTPWSQAESIEAWLTYLEEALRDVILERDSASDLTPINHWAETVSEHDSVLTFNYDTLVERALTGLNKPCNHGIGSDGDSKIPVFKLHGSIDWIVAHRLESFHELDLLFDKQNTNRSQGNTGHIEDDCRLWRCRSRDQLSRWIRGRDWQEIPPGAVQRTVGIAGLGAYKELHRIPGLGAVWARGMQALYQADLAVVVGFSMSDFDTMAQMQFAEVAQARHRDQRPLRVIVIDPFADKAYKDRFRRVFRVRDADFLEKDHEAVDWTRLE